MKNYLSAAICLTIGNFLYQLMQLSPDWGTAVERSFFMAAAVIAVGISNFLDYRNK